MPKNSLCGLINNISMQYDYLLRLVMYLCESVQVWQREKLQPHSCEEGCNGNIDLMSGLRCCVIWMEQNAEVKLSVVKWCAAFHIFQLNCVNRLITIDCVKVAMHDNMFNVLGILATVTHMRVNKIKLMKLCLKLFMPSFGHNESCHR